MNGNREPLNLKEGNNLTHKETELNETTVFQCPVFKVQSLIVDDGITKDAQRWIILRPNSVVVFAERPDGRILAIRQYRTGSNCHAWRFPTGSVEEGESSEVAAVRELFGETGLKAITIKELCTLNGRSGWIREKTKVF